MDSTFHERYENTKTLILNDQITPAEAVIHLYYFFRFEMQFAKAMRAQAQMRRYGRKLDENLEVFKLRMQMAESKI